MAPEGQGASADTPCLPEHLDPAPRNCTPGNTALGTALALSCWGLAGSWTHSLSSSGPDPTWDCCTERPRVSAPYPPQAPAPVCSLCPSAYSSCNWLDCKTAPGTSALEML